MDLQLANKYFIIGGAGSGFGRAVTLALVKEGATVMAVSRTEKKLLELKKLFPKNIELLTGDITKETIQSEIAAIAAGKNLYGIFFNSGGPAAGTFNEITMQQWDEAYYNIVRWKISLTKLLLPQLIKQHGGRLIYLESISVKQPVENLILSNSLRASIVGFVKTLSQELATTKITANVIAPGYHNTSAMNRLFNKKSEQTGKPIENIISEFNNQIPVGNMGEPSDLASLVTWLFSPYSKYITGQTISHDGGLVKGLFG
jgi:3-oxoacyl-[acyl-carrier protein] reductase